MVVTECKSNGKLPGCEIFHISAIGKRQDNNAKAIRNRQLAQRDTDVDKDGEREREADTYTGRGREVGKYGET